MEPNLVSDVTAWCNLQISDKNRRVVEYNFEKVFDIPGCSGLLDCDFKSVSIRGVKYFFVRCQTYPVNFITAPALSEDVSCVSGFSADLDANPDGSLAARIADTTQARRSIERHSNI
jgi:hypothetical protein